MDQQTTRNITARIVFLIGLLLMSVGSAFLLGTLEGTTPFSVLRAFFFVIIGVLFAFFAIKLHKRSLYLFFAAFFLLVGLFLFLSALQLVPFSFSESWPLLSIFAGLALLPSGWYRFGAIRTRYVVPAMVFVFLGCVLMIFSFRMVPFSFKQFVVHWWFLFVVLAGLILVLLALGTNNNSNGPSNEGPPGEGGDSGSHSPPESKP